jgi:hypothetical protein
MGALLRHLINPVLADLLYCGAGVGIALIKISSRFAGCCCSIEPVELTKCGYDFITRQEPYCAEVVTTVTIDHALTDHNLLGAALGDVTPQSTRAGHGDPDDIEPYARARMSGVRLSSTTQRAKHFLIASAVSWYQGACLWAVPTMRVVLIRLRKDIICIKISRAAK